MLNPDGVIIKLNVFNLSHYNFTKELEKIANLLKIYNGNFGYEK